MTWEFIFYYCFSLVEVTYTRKPVRECRTKWIAGVLMLHIVYLLYDCQYNLSNKEFSKEL